MDNLDTMRLMFGRIVGKVPEQLVLLACILHADSDWTVKISRAELVKFTGLTERQVRTATENLIKNVQLNVQKTSNSGKVLTICELYSYESENQNLRQKTSNKTSNLKSQKETPIDYQKVIDLWNATCTKLSKVAKISDTRRTAIRTRAKDMGDEYMKGFEKVFNTVAETPHYNGTNDRNWTADFDWVMKASNFTRLLEKTIPQATQSKITASPDENYRMQMRKRWPKCSSVQRPLEYSEAIRLKEVFGDKVYLALDSIEQNGTDGIYFMYEAVKQKCEELCRET